MARYTRDSVTGRKTYLEDRPPHSGPRTPPSDSATDPAPPAINPFAIA